MWDLIVSVPDHCLSLYFAKVPLFAAFRVLIRFVKLYILGILRMNIYIYIC